MKKSLVLAMAMALGVTASAYAANPFSDVPAGHWAYDSVNSRTGRACSCSRCSAWPRSQPSPQCSPEQLP